jgi:hypothetical protein
MELLDGVLCEFGKIQVQRQIAPQFVVEKRD